MLGIASFATVLTLIGGLGIQMNAYLADNSSNVDESTRPITLEAYVRDYFTDSPILADIAGCESEFRQFTSQGKIMRGEADVNDVGLMQINERYHLSRAKTLGYNLYSIEGNMAYARYLYEKEGTKPWNASKACWSKVNRQVARN